VGGRAKSNIIPRSTLVDVSLRPPLARLGITCRTHYSQSLPGELECQSRVPVRVVDASPLFAPAHQNHVRSWVASPCRLLVPSSADPHISRNRLSADTRQFNRYHYHPTSGLYLLWEVDFSAADPKLEHLRAKSADAAEYYPFTSEEVAEFDELVSFDRCPPRLSALRGINQMC